MEGPTLAERIAQGPVPLEEGLPIARQIAEALEYAHEKQVIHRDLKPADIKIAPDSRVKVLDFGLAKALTVETAAGDPASSPTLTMRATMAGVIMGTAGYMSPEQARAQSVDKRADIWAFGAVLYQMLTGRAAFPGDTVSDTLAAVLKMEPDWSALPADTPAVIRELLRRCLEKDPRRRLRDIGEARIQIEDYLSHPAPAMSQASSGKTHTVRPYAAFCRPVTGDGRFRARVEPSRAGGGTGAKSSTAILRLTTSGRSRSRREAPRSSWERRSNYSMSSS